MPNETNDATKLTRDEQEWYGVHQAMESLATGTELTPDQMLAGLAEWINQQGPALQELLRRAAIDQYRAMNAEGGAR